MSDHTFPILVPSISSTVYSALKKDIMEGTLEPGSRLIVLEIAGRYQISQAPVREALERLKQEGLIIGQPNKGSVVSSISSKEIKDLFILREMIESFTVRQAIPLLKEHDYRKLESILSEMETAIQAKDSIAILEKDMEFHGYFYKISNNEAILEVWNRMRTKIMRFMAISNRYYSTEFLVDWHMKLIHVLKSGDEEEAVSKFIEHMHAYKMIELE